MAFMFVLPVWVHRPAMVSALLKVEAPVTVIPVANFEHALRKMVASIEAEMIPSLLTSG